MSLQLRTGAKRLRLSAPPSAAAAAAAARTPRVSLSDRVGRTLMCAQNTFSGQLITQTALRDTVVPPSRLDAVRLLTDEHWVNLYTANLYKTWNRAVRLVDLLDDLADGQVEVTPNRGRHTLSPSVSAEFTSNGAEVVLEDGTRLTITQGGHDCSVMLDGDGTVRTVVEAPLYLQKRVANPYEFAPVRQARCRGAERRPLQELPPVLWAHIYEFAGVNVRVESTPYDLVKALLPDYKVMGQIYTQLARARENAEREYDKFDREFPAPDDLKVAQSFVRSPLFKPLFEAPTAVHVPTLRAIAKDLLRGREWDSHGARLAFVNLLQERMRECVKKEIRLVDLARVVPRLVEGLGWLNDSDFRAQLISFREAQALMLDRKKSPAERVAAIFDLFQKRHEVINIMD